MLFITHAEPREAVPSPSLAFLLLPPEWAISCPSPSSLGPQNFLKIWVLLRGIRLSICVCEPQDCARCCPLPVHLGPAGFMARSGQRRWASSILMQKCAAATALCLSCSSDFRIDLGGGVDWLSLPTYPQPLSRPDKDATGRRRRPKRVASCAGRFLYRNRLHKCQ